MFVGARNGHFPDCLSLITTNNFTPTPALVFLVRMTTQPLLLLPKVVIIIIIIIVQGSLSLLYLSTSDIYRLIDYCSFVESMFILWSVCALLYLRWTRPNMKRPIQVAAVL